MLADVSSHLCTVHSTAQPFRGAIYPLNMTDDCPFLRRNFEIRNKIFNSCNSWSNENISVKFSRIVENSFRYRSWNFGEKSLLVVEKLHFVQCDTFEPPDIHDGKEMSYAVARKCPGYVKSRRWNVRTWEMSVPPIRFKCILLYMLYNATIYDNRSMQQTGELCTFSR